MIEMSKEQLIQIARLQNQHQRRSTLRHQYRLIPSKLQNKPRLQSLSLGEGPESRIEKRR